MVSTVPPGPISSFRPDVTELRVGKSAQSWLPPTPPGSVRDTGGRGRVRRWCGHGEGRPGWPCNTRSPKLGRASLCAPFSHISLASAGGCAWCAQGACVVPPRLPSCSTVCAALLSFSPTCQACPTLTSCLALARNTLLLLHPFPRVLSAWIIDEPVMGRCPRKIRD